MKTPTKTFGAALLRAAALAALMMASRAHAGQVTVTGEFTSFLPDLAMTDSTLTAYGAGGTTTLTPTSQMATALPTGTDKIDFKFTSSSSFLTNTFAFTSALGADVNPGDIFKLGSFTFTNGTWFNSIQLAFTLTTHSDDLALDQHTFSGTMVLVVNPNVAGNPYLSADYFHINERPDLGSVRVFEQTIQPPGNPGSTGTADLYGKIGSLIPTSFANSSGGAFLSPSITSDPGISAVPEPGSVGLMASALACVAVARRLSLRKNRTRTT